MKNLLITLIFLFTIEQFKAQERLSSYALQIGHWNEFIQDFNWENVKYCDVGFLIQGDIIIANDEAKSTYYTYNNFDQSELVNSWEAFDEGRRKCIVTMMFGKTSYFIVTYSDICYRYFVNL